MNADLNSRIQRKLNKNKKSKNMKRLLLVLSLVAVIVTSTVLANPASALAEDVSDEVVQGLESGGNSGSGAQDPVEAADEQTNAQGNEAAPSSDPQETPAAPSADQGVMNANSVSAVDSAAVTENGTGDSGIAVSGAEADGTEKSADQISAAEGSGTAENAVSDASVSETAEQGATLAEAAETVSTEEAAAEKTTEQAAQSETDVLSFADDRAQVKIARKDGTGFPSDTTMSGSPLGTDDWNRVLSAISSKVKAQSDDSTAYSVAGLHTWTLSLQAGDGSAASYDDIRAEAEFQGGLNDAGYATKTSEKEENGTDGTSITTTSYETSWRVYAISGDSIADPVEDHLTDLTDADGTSLSVDENGALQSAAFDGSLPETVVFAQIVRETVTTGTEKKKEIPMPAVTFDKEATTDHGTITVHVEADEGTFEQGTTMSVKRVSSQDILDKAIEAAGGRGSAAAVDISFRKADGTETEPAKPIRVKMTAKVLSQADKVHVVHVDDTGSTDVVAKKSDGKTIESTSSEAASSDAKNAVSFESDSFSVYAIVYTVDFETVDGGVYSIPGEGSYKLNDLLPAIIGKEGVVSEASLELVEGEEVEGALYLTQDENGDWWINSDVAFTSTYLLTITVNGIKYEVKVTDQNSDITRYIIGASISGNSSGSGVTVDGDSWRLDDPQGNYNISLNFSESGLSKQFPTIASGDTSLVLTYKLPNGLKVDAQSGSTVFADATTGKSFNLPWTMDANGNISFVIDDQTVLYTDPDGTQWTAYDIYNGVPNARININFTGSWDGTTNEINFGNNVIKDVHASSDKTGEFNLEKSSKLENNRIKYTIIAESNFPVSEATLTDTMTAQNGITIDPNVEVTGSNVNYWTTSYKDGKLTASLKMPEGQTTSKNDKTWFTYYADIDYASLDADKDGKVTLNVDNTVSDDGGDTKTNNFTNTISYSNVTKGNGEAGAIYEENGEKYRDVTWTIKLNDSKLADMSGTTLTDWIEKNNNVSMEYSGQGLTIKATDTNGTETTSQVDWTDSSINKGTNSNGEPTWTYTFPSDAGKKAYEIRYTTKVKVTELQDETYINNKVKSTYGEGGSQGKIPGTAEVNATKTLIETSDTEDTWEIILDIPDNGLSNAWLTDNLPMGDYNGKKYYDSLVSYEVIGAVQGDYWKVTSSGDWGFNLNFYKDEACTQSGLKGTGQSRQIKVRVKTRVNQDWFDDPLFTTAHTNNVNFNNHKSDATATHKKSSMQKTLGKVETHNDFLVNGVKYRTLPYTVTFQNPTEGIIFKDELNIDGAIFVTAENKQTYRLYNNVYDVRAGENSWDQVRVEGFDYNNKVKVTGNGNAVTFDLSDAMAKNGDDEYYRYYIFEYYVVVPVEALQNLAKTSGQGYVDVKNTATWGDHSSSSDYKVPYEHLDKRMINEGSIGGDNRAAQFEIKSNPEGIRINNGSPYKLTDTFSDNLSLDYNSIKCDPESALISYTVSQNTIAFWLQDGVAATLTYEGKVVGEGQLNIKNTAETEYSKKEYSTTKTFNAEAQSGGSSAILKVLKIDENNALIRLPGVKFVLDYDQESSEGHGHIKYKDTDTEVPEAQRTFTTNDKGIAEIKGGRDWTLFFDTDYQLTEVQSSTPEGYRINETVYKFRIASDGKVDWSKHQYYNDYVMQIKNTPKHGKLSVSKTVTNGKTSDQSKTFDVKVTFYNDEAMTEIALDMTGTYGDVDVVNGIGTFEIKHGNTVVIDDIPDGKYYRVEETSTGNYTTTYNGKVSNDGATGHIIDNSDEKVTINNDIIPKGSIMVQKTWDPDPTEDTQLTINLFRRKKGETGNAEYLSDIVSTTGSSSVVLSKSNNWTGGWINSTFINTDDYDYFIRESNRQAEGYTGTYKQGDTVLRDWSVNGNDNKPVVKIDATQDPVIINIHNEKKTGSLKLTKEVQVNGDTPTNANKALTNGTYEFTITSVSDSDDTHTVKITFADGIATSYQLDTKAEVTITNGANPWTIEVPDLAAGDYTIQETTPTNGTSLTSATGGKSVDSTTKVVTVTVEAGKTEDKVPTTAIGTFTNNINTGSITIQKDVTTNGATLTEDFKLALKDSTGKYYALDGSVIDISSNTEAKWITFSKSGESKTWTNLPAGKTYTVEEKDPTAVANYTWSKDGVGDVTLGDTANATGSKTVTNTYTPNPGKLEITKTLTINSAEPTSGATGTASVADGTYTFEIWNEEGTEQITKDASNEDIGTLSITITDGVANPAKISVDNLPVGKYIVVETTPTDGSSFVSASGGDTATVNGKNGVKVEVTAGGATVPTAAFTNNKNVGNLSVTKTWDGLDAEDLATAQATFTITVAGKGINPAGADETTKNTKTLTWADLTAAGGTVTFYNLPVGEEYTVTESLGTAETTINQKYTARATNVTSGSKAITTGETQSVALKNEYDKKPGSLRITKAVTIDGTARSSEDPLKGLADGTYTFNVYKSDGSTLAKKADGTDIGDITITVTGGVANTVEVTGLAEGTYVIKEDTFKSSNKAAKIKSGDEAGKSVDVVAGTTRESAELATITNDYALTSVKVTKTWANGEIPEGTEVDVTLSASTTDPMDVLLANSAIKTATVTLKKGEDEKTWTNLPVYDSTGAQITYSVAETKVKTADGEWTTTSTPKISEVFDVTGETLTNNEATINNTPLTGKLDVTKELKYNGATDTSDGNKTFYAALFNSEGTIVSEVKTITVAGGTSGGTGIASFTGLKAGVAYTLKETDAGGTPVADSFEYAVTYENQNFTLKRGELEKTAKITNDKSEKGQLTVNKTVKYNGATDTEAGTNAEPMKFKVAIFTKTVDGQTETYTQVGETKTIKVKAGVTTEEAVFENLDIGTTYYVFEMNGSERVGTKFGSYTVTGSGAAFTPTRTEKNGTKEIVNEETETGKITVTKQLKKDGSNFNATEAVTFTVGLYEQNNSEWAAVKDPGNNSNNWTKTISIAAGSSSGTAEFSPLTVGKTYRVYEVDDSGKKIESGQYKEFTVSYDNQPTLLIGRGSDKEKTATVTNTIETTSIKAKKNWPSGQTVPNGTKVTLSIAASVSEGTIEGVTVVPASVELDGIVDTADLKYETTAWEYEWKDLPKYDKNGKEVIYTVTETGYVIGSVSYDSLIKNADNPVTEGYNFSFTNELPKIEIPGTKTWVDAEETHDNPKLTLTRKVGEGNPETLKAAKAAPIVYSAEGTVNLQPIWSSDGKTYRYSNLPKYAPDGSEYIYNVTEDEIERYTSEAFSHNNGDFGSDFVNTELTTFKFSKVWRTGGDNTAQEWPSGVGNITVTLKREAKEGDTPKGVNTVTYMVTPNSITSETSFGHAIARPTEVEDGYTYEIKNLPKFFVNGESVIEWTYSISETQVEGYNDPKYFEANSTENHGTSVGSGGTIVNDQITVSLPETGGSGTTPYTAAGSLLLGLSALAYIFKKKNDFVSVSIKESDEPWNKRR